MSSHPADVESFSLWLCEETKMYWQREVEVDSLVWWPVWPNLVNFRHFCNSLKAFGKFLLVLFSIWQNIEPCLAIFYIIGQINIVTISQVLKNNLGRSGHTDINFVRPTDRKFYYVQTFGITFWSHPEMFPSRGNYSHVERVSGCLKKYSFTFGWQQQLSLGIEASVVDVKQLFCSWCYKTFFGGNLENLDFLLNQNRTNGPF